jgi:hypothetical protein
MRAAGSGAGLLHPDCDEVLRDYYRFTDEGARAAFADKWVRLAARQMDRTWVAFYELLRIIRDKRLYEDARYMSSRQACASFEEYWDTVAGKPFATWLELEKTYHLVRDHAPGLLKGTLADATKAVQKRAEGAPDLNPPGVKNRDITGSNTTSQPINGRRDAAYFTARIARDRPDLLERMKAGEFTSVRRAAIEAGLVTPTVAVPLDPVLAARTILRRFGPEAARQLARLLTDATDSADGR